MKRLLFFILLLSLSLNSQEVQQVEVVKNDNQILELFEELGQNELKLDIGDMLGFPAFDINYERINDPYSSFGVSLFLNVSNNSSFQGNWTDKFTLSPFYRFYFFNKKDYGGAGFFAEIFTKFSFGKHDVEYYNLRVDYGSDYIRTKEENFFDIAPGAGIGQKWLNKKGWTFEINLGVGRHLLNKDFSIDSSGQEVNYLRPVAAFKGGLFIGKRF